MLMFCYFVHVLYLCSSYFCFVKQKTAYEMRISDWSSDVCSSDLSGGKCLFDIALVVDGKTFWIICCGQGRRVVAQRSVERRVDVDRTRIGNSFGAVVSSIILDRREILHSVIIAAKNVICIRHGTPIKFFACYLAQILRSEEWKFLDVI